jgi:hypothetical protein
VNPGVKPQNRRWWRPGVSLKMALVLLTAFCLWLGMVVAPALRQERIVRAVEEAGGEVSYDYEWDAEVREMIEWDGIGGQGPAPEPPGPRWLRKLVGKHYFCNVVYVSFRDAPRVDDKLVSELGKLSELRYLDLIECRNVTDAGILKWPTSLPLRMLDLQETAVSDKGVAHLSRFGTLESLVLERTVVSEAGIDHLSQLEHLWQLHIRHTKVTKSSLPTLRNMEKLRILSIDADDFSGEEATRLKEVKPNLRVFH